MKLHTRKLKCKKYRSEYMTTSELPSLHLFTGGGSSIGPYNDIEFLKKFKHSARESLATAREIISPSEEPIDGHWNSYNSIPKEFVPGLICLKNRLLHASNLILFNAPELQGLSSEIMIYFAKIVAKCENMRILLLDCNLRTPILHQKFDLPQKDGLLEYLSAKIRFNKIIKETKFANIHVITSGVHKASPTNLFTSYTFSRLIKTIKTKFDLILFDSPPYQKYGDAYILSRYLPSVLLILQDKEDNLENVKDIREELGRIGVSLFELKLTGKGTHIINDVGARHQYH